MFVVIFKRIFNSQKYRAVLFTYYLGYGIYQLPCAKGSHWGCARARARVATYSERLTSQEVLRERNLDPPHGKNEPTGLGAHVTVGGAEARTEVLEAELKERRTDGTKLPAMYDELGGGGKAARLGEG